MFKNYLLISLRNLVRNRVYAAINIIGLGVALGIAIVAWFNYQFDAGFDRQHKNFDSIYRVTSFREMQGREQEYGLVPATLGPEIGSKLTGVESWTRIFNSRVPVKLGNEIFSRGISFIDPAFFDIFTITIVSGDPSALDEKNNILISQNLAGDLFGEDDPLGRSVEIYNNDNEAFLFTISGVFADLPDNNSFRFDILSHSGNYLTMYGLSDTDWKLWANVMFLHLAPGADREYIVNAMNAYLGVQNSARRDFLINRFSLIPMKDVGDTSREIWVSSLFPGLHPAASFSPPLMALFILLIACFNFANTTIASMGRRLREIGLRKTFGGYRSQLLVQFLAESVLISALALLVGIAVGRFLVPAYGSLWEYMTLEMTLAGNWTFLLFLAAMLLVTGFLSGVYPALVISRLNPVMILRSQTRIGKRGLVSTILLTLQFTISISALVMGIVFYRNAEYQETLDLGYDRESIVVVPVTPESYSRLYETVRSNPMINSIAGTQQHIGFGMYRRALKDEDQQVEVDVMDTGPRYAETMGLRLVEGRLFDEDRVEADRQGSSIVVNQQFVKDFGWSEAVGRTVTMFDTLRLTVIGVVEDYYASGLWQAIEPSIIRLAPDDTWFNMVVSASPSNLPAVYAYLEEQWKALFPSYIFTGIYQEETLQEGKDINESIMKINLFLALVATLMSLIGIYSMVSLSVLHRTREIGIRNVAGAPVGGLVLLLSRPYIAILSVSSVIGCSAGYYLSKGLLDSIWDYFIDISAAILLLAVAIMFLATALTVTGRTYRAATMNPVDALQSE